MKKKFLQKKIFFFAGDSPKTEKSWKFFQGLKLKEKPTEIVINHLNEPSMSNTSVVCFQTQKLPKIKSRVYPP